MRRPNHRGRSLARRHHRALRCVTQVEPPIRVLFHDDRYVAVDKPTGMLVHRTRLSADQTFLLQAVRNLLGRRIYPIHRLDRAASGVIMFGLDHEAASRLHAAFEQQRVEKIYHAVVRGWLPVSGIIRHTVRDSETGGAPRPAITCYRQLARVELPVAVDHYPTARYALAEVRPKTGRRHQIRKHFKHIGHPLIGDTSYGKGTHNRFFREQFASHRLLLLARELAFIHPFTGRLLRIRARTDTQWQSLTAALGWVEG